jgi:hypothetical protein
MAPLLLAALIAGCSDDAAAPVVPPVLRGDAVLKLSKSRDIGVAYADSSVNVSSFRQPVIALSGGRRLVSFYDAEGDVRLKVFSADDRELRSVRVGPRLDENLLGDGHCVISLGQSPDGVVHVMYGAHATPPFYARIPESELTLENGPAEFQAITWPRIFSYPQFYHVGDSFQLWFRADPESAVHRTPYDQASGQFVNSAEQQVLAHGNADRVYMNHLAIQGDKIGLSWMYRLFSNDDLVRNEGLYVAFSPDRGATWRDAGGTSHSLPIDRGVVAPFLSLPAEAQPMNQTASAFAPDGRLFITYLAKDARGIHQVSLAELSPQGTLTGTQAVSGNQTAYDLFGRGTLVLPLSRPQIAVSDKYVHVIYRQDNQIRVSSRPLDGGALRHLTIDAGNLGPWEPTLATDLWVRQRKLVVYVQETRQGALDKPDPGPPTQARLFEFTETGE